MPGADPGANFVHQAHFGPAFDALRYTPFCNRRFHYAPTSGFQPGTFSPRTPAGNAQAVEFLVGICLDGAPRA